MLPWEAPLAPHAAVARLVAAVAAAPPAAQREMRGRGELVGAALEVEVDGAQEAVCSGGGGGGVGGECVCKWRGGVMLLVVCVGGGGWVGPRAAG